MSEAFWQMRAEIEQLRTAFGNSLKVGPVAEVDAGKGYRLRLGGSDDEPFLSPWYPHPETGKTSVPLKKGQVVGVVNPTGDPRQGFVIRGGYSDENASPNDDMDANVFKDAGVKLTIKDGELHVESRKAVRVRSLGVVKVEATDKVDIEAGSEVNLSAPSVNFGGERVSLGGPNGKPVARIGDLVHVKSGSSTGLWEIVTGSSVVFAVD